MKCPNDEQLAQLAAGKLAGEELTAIEGHLDGCAPCRSLFAAVSNGSAPYTQPERAGLAAGEKLGRYEIERLIAAGGMGMLYVARDTQLNRRVAVKLMRPAFGGEVGRLRLLREAQAMASLSHPNVVHVYELGEVDGRVFVAMELVEGGTLRDVMKRKDTTWRELVDVFIAAGRGLAAAHESGVIHRDFKPENVLVGRDGRPRVGDFGLSRPDVVAEEEPPRNLPMKITHTGTMLGTPAYMSPEQLAGRPADARSDQYGFCVCLYEALAGKRPFPADSLEELRARVSGGMPPPPKDGLVPAHVWAAIARGLHPDPAQRFPDLEALLTVLSFGAPEPKRATRWQAIAGIVAAAGLTLGVGIAVLLNSRPVEPVPAVAVTPPPPAPPPKPKVDEDAPPKKKERVLGQVVELKPLPPGQVTALDFPKTMKLGVNMQRVLTVPRLQRVAVGDVSIADLKTIGDSQLLVVGAGAGRTTVLVWTSDQKRHELTVEVVEELPKEQYEGVVDLDVGTQGALTLRDVALVATGNAGVVDVRVLEEKVLLTGASGGQSSVLVWTADRKQHSFLVKVRAASDLPEKLTLGVQMQRIFDLPGLKRLAVGDPAIADVRAQGSNGLMIAGKSKGTTNVLVWTKDKRHEVTVEVVEAGHAGPTDSDLDLAPGMKKLLDVPGLQRVAVGDDAICGIETVGNDQLQLTGKSPGRTTLLVWGKDGKRSGYLLNVRR